MRVIGGREIHPINVRVGGFYRAPTRAELAPVIEELERAREFALEAVGFTASLPCPDFEEDFVFLALRDLGVYAIEGGRLVSSTGLDLAPSQYDEHIVEEHVEHSTALHSRLPDGTRYLVGPLARYALNRDKLSPAAREAADAAGLEPVCRNPFRSIVVRAVEILYALDEALRLLDAYEPPDPPAVEVLPRAGVGFGWTEAPRGLLWHRYEIDDEGTILDARIVPPTSQNQGRIEQSLYGFVQQHVELADDELRLRCEQAVRSYDPCISCATHFLRLEIDRQ
jgi:coenzyme F420-reducing hydrogenase alpha subunit